MRRLKSNKICEGLHAEKYQTLMKESKLKPKEMKRDFEFVGWKTPYEEDGHSTKIDLRVR